jgi:hypothetical protein
MSTVGACRRFALSIVSAAALLSPPLTASQVQQAPQPQQASPPARVNPGLAGPTNSELAMILDAYAIVQAQNALQLEDDQYGRFVSRLKRLQDTRRRGTQARNRLVQELRKLTLDPAADETLMRERLKALRDIEEQSAAANRREYDALDEVLTPRQQIRFRLFEEQLERRKLDLLLRARNRAARAAQPKSDGER